MRRPPACWLLDGRSSTRDQGHEEEDKEHEETDLRDHGGRACDNAEAEDAGYKRDHKEQNGIMEHNNGFV